MRYKHVNSSRASRLEGTGVQVRTDHKRRSDRPICREIEELGQKSEGHLLQAAGKKTVQAFHEPMKSSKYQTL